MSEEKTFADPELYDAIVIDRFNYPRFWWKIKYFLLALWYAVLPNKHVKI